MKTFLSLDEKPQLHSFLCMKKTHNFFIFLWIKKPQLHFFLWMKTPTTFTLKRAQKYTLGRTMETTGPLST